EAVAVVVLAVAELLPAPVDGGIGVVAIVAADAAEREVLVAVDVHPREDLVRARHRLALGAGVRDARAVAIARRVERGGAMPERAVLHAIAEHPVVAFEVRRADRPLAAVAR